MSHTRLVGLAIPQELKDHLVQGAPPSARYTRDLWSSCLRVCKPFKCHVPTYTIFTPPSSVLGSSSECVKCLSTIICVWVPSSCHLTTSRERNGLHDLCKGIKVIIKGSKSSLSHQGPLIQQMWVQRLLHQARGIMGFFNHLSHARGPLWVKIHYDMTCGVARPSLRVPWHHQSMNDHRMGH